MGGSIETAAEGHKSVTGEQFKLIAATLKRTL